MVLPIMSFYGKRPGQLVNFKSLKKKAGEDPKEYQIKISHPSMTDDPSNSNAFALIPAVVAFFNSIKLVFRQF